MGKKEMTLSDLQALRCQLIPTLACWLFTVIQRRGQDTAALMLMLLREMARELHIHHVSTCSTKAVSVCRDVHQPLSS